MFRGVKLLHVAVQTTQLIMESSPYNLGLGMWGTHRTFRPLSLIICNNTFLPPTDAAYVAEAAHIAKRWRLDELTQVHTTPLQC